MNYTPLPSSLFTQTPTSHSPYKKALATILIAMFLGIGTTYVYFRNSTPKEVTPEATPVITVIPSPLPTVEPLESLPTSGPESSISCTSDTACVQCPPLGQCTQGSCISGFCSWTSPKTTPSSGINPTTSSAGQPTITPNPVLFSCSAGTVKVCQGGDCECVASNQ